MLILIRRKNRRIFRFYFFRIISTFFPFQLLMSLLFNVESKQSFLTTYISIIFHFLIIHNERRYKISTVLSLVFSPPHFNYFSKELLYTFMLTLSLITSSLFTLKYFPVSYSLLSKVGFVVLFSQILNFL